MHIPITEVVRLCQAAHHEYVIPQVARYYGPEGIPFTIDEIRRCMDDLVNVGRWAEWLNLPTSMLDSYICTQVVAWDHHGDAVDGIMNAREYGATEEECRRWKEDAERQLLKHLTYPTYDMLAYAIEQGQLATA